MPAMALWMRMWDTWASADWNDALALGDKALAGIEAEYEAGDPLALCMWGALHLQAAISYVRGANAAGSDERPALARAASERVNAYVGPEIHDRHSVTFSLGNVILHSVSAALSDRRRRSASTGRRTPRTSRSCRIPASGTTTWTLPARGCGTGTATRP